MFKMIGKRLKDQRGLTLVELLAVVVILGIIAAIAVPSIGNIMAKSKYDAAKADAVQLLSAGKLFIAANGTPSVSTGYSNGDTDTDKKFKEYIEITDANLSAWTVTITPDGKITIDATSKHQAKGEVSGTKFVGDLNKVNSQQFDKHSNS
ncbi:prepilin-type N-terminal cleavage/methylation domain-containing protein [Bacillus sp. DTU_2020_1000418_1_SI_GHA_SEK_038]|uniref:type IV pilin protein n=1 Tax=Bacillus sp. DTU_2020_1000418_1_SI_GHA_SEK_038 TaxID=3077585 RepID=UPI0028E9212D|nr:prepilin-type N-terminal cleavage/methylation domain-containing protein [Bacillus sp. DTU_2020_1000418_1_SI_GHA_SEK_038]WNS74465.1 prepilin-type N-terminal cleavage/methylation domain-containing protein [Bacillus sp. DTU_2020_1000418_1_SI_GHA_SEK_038]